eukprot:GGOE01014844.1.p1 GENE.GGOE01014844.1~~GGOE01014844.1.p1  ORF type:complete len:290 (-),score=105.88 GGOE01014844.1:287-1156(-)
MYTVVKGVLAGLLCFTLYVFLIDFLGPTARKKDLPSTGSATVSPLANVSDSAPRNAGFDHVYVLNLPKRTDRRRYMEDLLVKRYGLEVEFFPAVDGHAPNAFIDHCQKTTKDRWNKVPQRGYIGSRMTHVALLLDQLSHGFEKVLVFEDDVIVTRDEDFRNMHRYVAALPADWDMVFFGYCFPDNVSVPVSPLLYRVQKEVFCMQHYGIRHKAAAALLREMADFKRPRQNAHDRIVADYIASGQLNVYRTPTTITSQYWLLNKTARWAAPGIFRSDADDAPGAPKRRRR